MFKELNGKLYNLVYSQSINKLEKDGKYEIVYKIINGQIITETFESVSERDAKYNEVMTMTSAAGFKPEVVDALPTSDISDTTVYLIPSENPKTQNTFDEYMYINGKWECIGNTGIDLSGYYTKAEVDTIASGLGLPLYYMEDFPDNFSFSGAPQTVKLKGLKKGVYIKRSTSSSNTKSAFGVYYETHSGGWYTRYWRGLMILIKDIPETSPTGTEFFGFIPDYNSARDWVVNIGNAGYINDYIRMPGQDFLTNSSSYSISGTYTFTTIPRTSVTPTATNHITNKSYVDSKVATCYTKAQTDTAINNAVANIDLTNYYTKSETDEIIGDIETLLGGI